MSQAKNIMMRVAVMLLVLTQVEATLINSALGEITLAFPDADPVLISWVSVIANATMFIFSFVAGSIAARKDSKKFAIVALIIYTVGGVAGFFAATSLPLLLVTRAILGIGAGLLAPLSGAIITRLFQGNDRAHMFGFSNGISSLIASGLSVVGGALMMIAWNYIFLVYAVFVIAIIVVFFFMPSLPPLTAADGGKLEKVSYEPKERNNVIFFAAFQLISMIGGMVIMLKLAIWITLGPDGIPDDATGIVNAIGDPLFIGSAFGLLGISSMIFSFPAGFANMALKNFSLLITPIATIIALTVLMLVPTQTGVLAGLFIYGISNGISMPLVQTRMAEYVRPVKIADGMSILFACFFMGLIISSFMDRIVGLLFGDPSIPSIWMGGIGLEAVAIVMAIIFGIVHLRDKKLPGEAVPVSEAASGDAPRAKNENLKR